MTTELHAAWVFDCDECGQENFLRAVIGDAGQAAMMLNEEQRTVEEVVGMLVAEEGDLVEPPEGEDPRPQYVATLYSEIALAPKFVTCQHCGHHQPAEVPKLMEPDDDDGSDDRDPGVGDSGEV